MRTPYYGIAFCIILKAGNTGGRLPISTKTLVAPVDCESTREKEGSEPVT
jgi:hypothetical protein